MPDEVVRRRFRRGLRNFFDLYSPLVDAWLLLDASHEEPALVVLSVSDQKFVFDQDLFGRIRNEERGS